MKRLLQFLALLSIVTILPLVVLAFVVSLHQPKAHSLTSSEQLSVRIDEIDLLLPNLPRLTFWSSDEIVPHSSPNVTSFSLNRGVTYSSYSPMDEALTSLSSYPDFGMITELRVGPVRQKNTTDPVRCMDRPVIILERESSIFCFPETAELHNSRKDSVSLIVASNFLQFFDAPVQMQCSTWVARITPDAMDCRIRGTMPNGLHVRFDLYSNQQNSRTWPYIDASLEEWQMHFTAMENALLAMIVK